MSDKSPKIEENGRDEQAPVASEFLDDRIRVLKCGDTFGVFNSMGDAKPSQGGGHGVYFKGTRYLSKIRMLINGGNPILLGSSVSRDNSELCIDLTNPAIREGERVVLDSDVLHVYRARFMLDAVFAEKVVITNHGMSVVTFELMYEFAADFADIFEVRGFTRAKRGEILLPRLCEKSVWLGYEGLDGVRRFVGIEADMVPNQMDENKLVFRVTLGPKSENMVGIHVYCVEGESQVEVKRIADHAIQSSKIDRIGCEITTSNEIFNQWLDRSYADLYLMMTNVGEHGYPYAGIPWYNTVFGRDGIWVAIFFMWVDPAVARGVIVHLARTQAKLFDEIADAEPGKILHESRYGEMSVLGEVPFGSYFGAVDSTPLFIVLVDEYYRRTGDLALVLEVWSCVLSAAEWMKKWGDKDGDGYLEYARLTPDGLVHQGWKDSSDSVFHADGTLAEGPISLCEVQGYRYAALRSLASLAEVLSLEDMRSAAEQESRDLRRRFDVDYWCEDMGFYALALDGKKRRCDVRTSNVGHLLWAEMVSEERARSVARMLMGPAMFSGWGIRTVAMGEVRYNPISYHNGSIWPHDNAIVASGLSRYGFKSAALQILGSLFDASIYFDLHRMPELYCGFSRRTGQGPTSYPTACSPQAWASASVFMLLSAVLGLSISGVSAQIQFHQPALPPWLEWIELRNLAVGEGSVDLLLRRARHDVGVEVLRKTGARPVSVMKSL